MRSPMIRNADYIPAADKQNYSELTVLESAAGFYIGTIYTHPAQSDTPGMPEPGSRDSQYFPTKEAAEEALRTRTWEQRWHP